MGRALAVIAVFVVALSACGENSCDMAAVDLVVIATVRAIDGSAITVRVESVPVNDTDLRRPPRPGDDIAVEMFSGADKLTVGERYRVPLFRNEVDGFDSDIARTDVECSPGGVTYVDGSYIDRPPWIAEHWEVTALVLCALLLGGALGLAVVSRQRDQRDRAARDASQS